MSFGLGVRYGIQVLNPDGSVAKRREMKRNLILDSGLDLVATNLIGNLTAYAAVGTGTTPVKRDSGAITFTRAGNVVTASAGFFEAGDVGRLLKFDSGAEMYVTGFTSSTQVTVGVSGALAASQGTVWYVNETGHATEVKRTNTYGSDSGDNDTTYAAGVFTFKRTYLFSAEAGVVVYNEIGWSPSAAAGNNLFGRDIISGGVALAAGQQLRVVCELSLAPGPSVSTAYANVVTGWSQNGNCALESVALTSQLMTYVGTTGAIVDGGAQTGGLEPSRTKRITLATGSDALSPMNTAQVGSVGGALPDSATAAVQAYSSGNFYRDYVGSWSVSQGNSAGIRSIQWMSNGGTQRIFRVLLNAGETKASTHTLSLTLRLSWSRTLVN
ncbi:MAG TPA: hypothetical protein VEB66_02290 [Opitutaceae bacterium]|nr:hypothetical protein [Opitutaceae bacterium]